MYEQYKIKNTRIWKIIIVNDGFIYNSEDIINRLKDIYVND